MERSMTKPNKHHFSIAISPLLGWFGITTTSLALSMYSYLGTFSRLYADDFCMSGLVVQRGFWAAQWIQYSTWSNRFAGMFTLTASDLFGPIFIQVWPMLIIWLWVLGLFWALWQTDRLLQLSAPKWMIFLVAEWIVLFSILYAPQLYQSLFWRVGAITYTLPLALMAFLHGMILKLYLEKLNGRKVWGWVVGTAVLAFFAGGFSETYLALQISPLIIVLLVVLVTRFKGNWRSAAGWAVAAAFMGSLISLAGVLLAPGNAVRQAAMPPPPGLLAFVKMDSISTFLFIYISMKNNVLSVLLAVLSPMLIFYPYFASAKDIPVRKPSALILGLFTAPLAGFLATALVMAPATYAQSSYPDGRVLMIASFVLALLLLIVGSLLGMILSQLHRGAGETVPASLRLLSALLAFAIFLYPLYDAGKSYRLIPEYRANAVAWDERDTRIQMDRYNGENQIEVVSLNAPGGLSDLQIDSHDWVNGCMASFYDVGSISATP